MSTLSKNSKSEITGKGYEFVSKGHSHYLDGEKLTGVTTVLRVISKGDALINWAANMAVDYIITGIEEARKDPSIKDFTKLFLEARTAHRKKKEAAGQKGTDVHAMIEDRIKEAISKNSGMLVPMEEGEIEVLQVIEFVNWAIKNKVKFLDCELHLYSKTHFLGGICDFVCEIDGEKWIGDIKTGGVYPEAFFQMAGYQILCEEMGLYPDIKGHIVIGLKNGLEDKRSISNEDNKQAFLNALSLYRIMAKVSGSLL